MNWLNKLLSGKDNSTPDLGRYSWAVSTVSIIGAGIWNALHAGVVDLQQAALALSAIAGAHGIAIGAKGHTEPDGSNQ